MFKYNYFLTLNSKYLYFLIVWNKSCVTKKNKNRKGS